MREMQEWMSHRPLRKEKNSLASPTSTTSLSFLAYWESCGHGFLGAVRDREEGARCSPSAMNEHGGGGGGGHRLWRRRLTRTKLESLKQAREAYKLDGKLVLFSWLLHVFPSVNNIWTYVPFAIKAFLPFWRKETLRGYKTDVSNRRRVDECTHSPKKDSLSILFKSQKCQKKNSSQFNSDSTVAALSRSKGLFEHLIIQRLFVDKRSRQALVVSHLLQITMDFVLASVGYANVRLTEMPFSWLFRESKHTEHPTRKCCELIKRLGNQWIIINSIVNE